MSKATKRKHVHLEALRGNFELPTENQQIAKILESRGNNLHAVQLPDATTFLVSMPNKFRKNIWIKKGDYVLVEPIAEGEKVKAEIVRVLRSDYIKYLMKENVWPLEFTIECGQNSGDGKLVTDCEAECKLISNNNQSAVSDYSPSSSDESE